MSLEGENKVTHRRTALIAGRLAGNDVSFLQCSEVGSKFSKPLRKTSFGISRRLECVVVAGSGVTITKPNVYAVSEQTWSSHCLYDEFQESRSIDPLIEGEEAVAASLRVCAYHEVGQNPPSPGVALLAAPLRVTLESPTAAL